MKTSIETPRLILRELLPTDDVGFFEMDSDPEVHLFLSNNPAKTIQDSQRNIENIHQQYVENGIGRWAVIIKETGEFAGWSGLKLEKNVNNHEQFYDLGYRFKPKFWNSGIATEAAKAFVDFGFNELKLDKICAYTSSGNDNSAKVLKKCGFKFINTFSNQGDEEFWFEIKNPNLYKSEPS